MEVNDGKAALLRELSGTHLLISAYPVSSSTAVLEVYTRVNNKVHNLYRIHLGLMNEWGPMGPSPITGFT